MYMEIFHKNVSEIKVNSRRNVKKSTADYNIIQFLLISIINKKYFYRVSQVFQWNKNNYIKYIKNNHLICERQTYISSFGESTTEDQSTLLTLSISE